MRLYDDFMYRFDTPPRSYWEATAGDIDVEAGPLDGDDSCDVAVIGGGYTGLSTAFHLARDHGVDVHVLDAGHIGWGASGRNGGFCCMGGTALGPGDLVKAHGEDDVRAYYRVQVEAVELVRALIAEETIDTPLQGDGELVTAHTPRAFEHLGRQHEVYTSTLGIDAELYSADEFRERFYDSTENHGGLVVRPTFGLHPLRYCRGLAAAAVRRGAVLHEHSEVVEWTRVANGLHRLATKSGALRARRVVVAANGFMPENLHRDFYGRTLPVISAIVATRPLSDEERARHGWRTENPAANSRRILNYYRMLPDGRLMFGGRGRGNGSAANEQRTYDELRATLGKLWPGWRDVDIEYAWQGFVCFTGSLRTTIGQLDDDPSVYFGYGYHGNGVSNATWAGRYLAELIGRGQAPAVPVIVRGLGRRFPLPRLRMQFLQLGIGLSRWLDRRG